MGQLVSIVSDRDPIDPWAQGMVSLVTARKEAVHQVGADFLPPKRYLRGGARPPVMRASWVMSISFSGDRQDWSPPGRVGLFRVTWEHGLLFLNFERFAGEGGRMEIPNFQVTTGKTTEAQSPCNHRDVITW